jgi:TorA maturation chaperone TorD
MRKGDGAASRGAIYGILAKLFTYPDDLAQEWILGGEWLDLFEQSARLLKVEGLKKYPALFRSALPDGPEEANLSFQREYTRLFINGFPRVIAPPYGSVYVDPGGMVYGPSTALVLQAYGEAGVTMRADAGDLPDRVNTEFEFMAYLTGREMDSPSSEHEKWAVLEGRFFYRFLAPWMNQFLTRIAEETALSFYRVLAKCTSDFVDSEYQFLKPRKPTDGAVETPAQREAPLYK